jgi:O-antigen ligase
MRLIDIKRPPNDDSVRKDHRHDPTHLLSPIGMVVLASIGVLLWHGGYRSGGQLLLAAVAAACVALVRPRPRLGVLRDPLVAGLSLAALANVASLLWHGRGGAPALAALAVAVITAWAAVAGPRLGEHVLVAELAVGLTCATAGIAGLLAHSRPLAERIAGIWRAGGTFEYPPALGLLTVCALAAALALYAEGTIDGLPAVVASVTLVAAGVASFDRVTVLELAAVAALYAVRVPDARSVVMWAAAAAVVTALVGAVVAGPSAGALERHLRHGPLSSREDAWRAGWDAVKQRPWLGYGPGTRLPVGPAAGTAAPPAEAHNAVLQQGLGAGLAAALGTLVALAAMLVDGGRGLASRRPVVLACGVAATAIALSGLYDFTWSFAPLLLLGALAAVGCRERAP